MKFHRLIFIIALLLAPAPLCFARDMPGLGDYEGRPIADVEVVFENSPPDAAAEAEFRSVLLAALGSEYSAVRVRASLQSLLDTKLVASARVEVRDASGGAAPPRDGRTNRPVRLRYTVRRRVQVRDVRIDLTPVISPAISADEIRARVTLLDPGSPVSEQNLRRNADDIQTYLRDRGFYNADVTYLMQPDPSGVRATVTFSVKPGEQAHVGSFNINVQGFDPSRVRLALRLQQGAPFTRTALGDDVTRIRQAIIAQGYLAPVLDDPRVVRDPQNNLINVELNGSIGPHVTVHVNGYQASEKAERDLLPVKREGSLDYSAIVEGERRIRNKLQEDGYFFAEVTEVCNVTPPTPSVEANNSPTACQNLNPEDLSGHNVDITYNVDRGRRFKLTDIRIEGTNKISYDDVADQLKTRKANALGFIPLLGYGRGYTSKDSLESDRRTIEARMHDLGYRRAVATVRQGVSINGENLIITFDVNEGPLTRIAGVELKGNEIYTAARLRNELNLVIGAPFSRSQARADGNRILNLYARDGYIDAKLDFSVVDLPKKNGDEQVRLVYSIRNEGDKVFINRIVVNGVRLTKREAVLRAIPLTEGQVLRADQLSESERILYATDVFRQVIISTQPAGETASGFKKRDVIIDVEELKPRVLTYGGGYSTDSGPLGFVDLRNVDLFGKLRQGALRTRDSRLQQLLRLEYLDPYFQRYGKRQFAPLTFSAQYLRDLTITRFFRTTGDRGSFGIVQRLDQKNNPIDITGRQTKQPTLNRFTLTAETQRVLSQKTRSIVFLRYTYEDARLFNLSSLLIESILRPDRAIRTSRFGVSFVRDTREQCADDASQRPLTTPPGAPEPCKYNQFDATHGDYLSLNYDIALRQLGGNMSFNKLQANYRRYYKVEPLHGTVFAGNLSLGLANVFNPRDRTGKGLSDPTNSTLPISERFFAGGSTTLRGFGYQEAGPRDVAPECFKDPNVFKDQKLLDQCRIVRNDKGELTGLNPFTVPIGGNAMAIVNLEARVPLTKLFQVVPFYDGGNVFRFVSDIFHRGPRPGEDPNQRAHWTNTVGLGFRIKTPIGGSIGVDYGYLLNPPAFELPTPGPQHSIFRLSPGRINIRFTQTF